MSLSPDFAEFRRLAAAHELVPVYRTLAADTLTAVSAYHRLRTGETSFLFESVVGGEHVGRYSFLTSRPFLEFLAWDREILVRKEGIEERRRVENPLEELRRLVSRYRMASVEGLPPFVGGAVGYIGYDAVRYVERLPNAPPDDRRLPDISMAFYDQMVVLDNARKTFTVVALAHGPGAGADWRDSYDRAAARVEEVVSRMTREEAALPMIELPRESRIGTEDPHSRFPRSDFEAAAEQCVEYIRAGDIFQVVLSRRMDLPIRSSPFEIYRSLRTLNPSPFMFLLETPEVTLVGSSPEIMCRVVEGQVTVRPLAGTRRRGGTATEDQRLAEELLADPKERAEHVMLVDLGRNDVGRVARYGSVRLSDTMTVERYSHVMHLTSNVTAALAPGLDAFDALMACLPAGTVSGAPKIRAMQIIDELEPQRRGPYAGAVGYFDFRGNMDTCIALRTLVIQDGTAYVQAGAGIVAESQPSLEYEETMNKARVLLRTLDWTEQRQQAAEGDIS